MIIYNAKDIELYFGAELLFKNVTFEIDKVDKIGLVGVNGCGKTTLFKLLIKEYTGDSGSVTYGPGVKVGYYDQLMTGLSDKKTVMDEIWDAYPKMSQTEVRTALGSFLFSGEFFSFSLFLKSFGFLLFLITFSFSSFLLLE